MDKKTPLKDKIAATMLEADRPLHIKEIAENFEGIPESTIRGRLNENVGKDFQRVGKGIYILRWEKWTIGLINSDARDLTSHFEDNSVDLLIADHPWEDSKSHTGWSRSFASSYDCFKYSKEDFEKKYATLKEGGFLVEFLPEKNANNKQYLRDIEDFAEKSGFRYFAEVNVSWGNSNIGRKKKYISTAYFFTKWEPRKLKVWDEKISKKIKNWDFNSLKKEHLVDFKKIYSEVLTRWEGLQGRLPEAFDYKVSRGEAEFLLNRMWNDTNAFRGMSIMCKEYWDDDDWVELSPDDLDYHISATKKQLSEDYVTLELSFEDTKNKLVLFDEILTELKRRGTMNNPLLGRFMDELKRPNSQLPQFQKQKKNMAKLAKIPEWSEEYDKMLTEYTQFCHAFSEYCDFLQDDDSYKMWTRTILPEYFVWDLPPKKEKRHESQKPINTLEEIIMQCSRKWELVVEQFAGSFACGDAIVHIWEETSAWRDYIWIELDEERVKAAKEYLREKYKWVYIFTDEDFYSSLPEANKAILNSPSEKGNREHKKLLSIQNKIQEDLGDIFTVSLLNFDLGDKDTLTADNFVSDSWKILSVTFSSQRNMKEENRVLYYHLDPENNCFQIKNRKWELINTTHSGWWLDTSLIKLYNTFR